MMYNVNIMIKNEAPAGGGIDVQRLHAERNVTKLAGCAACQHCVVNYDANRWPDLRQADAKNCYTAVDKHYLDHCIEGQGLTFYCGHPSFDEPKPMHWFGTTSDANDNATKRFYRKSIADLSKEPVGTSGFDCPGREKLQS